MGMGCSLLISDLGQFSTHELAFGVEVDPKSNFYFIKETEPAVSLVISDVELPNVGTNIMLSTLQMSSSGMEGC